MARNLRGLRIACLVAIGGFALVPLAQARNPLATTITSEACNGGTVSISPSVLWPPNHKMRSAVVTYSDSSFDGGTLTLTVNSIDDDQSSVDGTGAGCGNPNQSSDWELPSGPATGAEGAISTDIGLRAERCAADGARMYDINVTCENDPAPVPTDTASPSPTATPAIQTIDLLVTVPHNRRKH